ncbi:MAG: NAD(P)-dependent oxidoreductase [Candidatus Gastranaerophilales bacterium]|nr:NAD(P)-dependent oxidoreductase [Candidatus Gastranaerophilales bacterium]
MELSSKTVVVTGAAGFIGLNIVKKYIEVGWKVYAVVHKNIPQELTKLDNVHLLQCDITNPKDFFEALGSLKPQILVHAAGLASDIGSDKKFKKINFEPIKYLSSVPTEKIIYISSTDVYGIKDFLDAKEDTTPFEAHPLNPYPKYKIESEKWLNLNLPPSKYVIIRPAAVYGDGDKTLENRVIEFLKSSPYIIHFGKWHGKNRWPLANVKNVALTIVGVSMSGDFDGMAINIIDREITSIDDYYNSIAKKYFPDKKFKTVTLPLYFGKFIGLISTLVSNLLRLKQPLFDPTFYAVHHVTSNLDFNGERQKDVIASLERLSSIKL